MMPGALRRYLPLLLFLATVGTTLGAGSLMAGADPFADPAALLEGVPFSASLLLILGAHEFSHYLTTRRHGIRSTLPLFIPSPSPLVGTFGAIIRISSPIPNRGALVELGVSGPLGGFLVAVPLAVVGLGLSRVETGMSASGGALLLGDPLIFKVLTRLVLGALPGDAQLYLHPMAYAAWIGFFVTALNLLPVGQLDGGHILYAMAGRRQVTVSRAVVLCLAPLGFLWWGWLLWGAILVFIGVAHPPVLRELEPLDRRHRALGWIGAALLALTFTPAPFSF